MPPRVLAAVALLACSAPAVAAAEGAGQGGFPCVGTWRGLGQTTGYATQWTIDMRVTAPRADGDCGTIEYTSPTCGGRMLDCRVENGLVHAREHYTHTDGNCAPAGRLELSCTGDRMQWAWVGWEVARSTLTRVDAVPAPPPTSVAEVPAPPAPVVLPPAPLVPPPASERPRERDPLGCGCSAPGRPAPLPLGLLIALTSGSLWRRAAAARAARARRGARAG